MTKHCLQLGKKKSLSDLAADATPDFSGDETAARAATDALRDDLDRLQQRLFAGKQQRLLLVLQAMDTGGKDGTIRKVFTGVNPQGVNVARFDRPTPVELAHDFLWRAHQVVPASGEIAIFNRSHYEDVLVVRVNELVPKKVWQRRYEHIRAFEKLLADEGTRILKVYLHIDRDEQKRRLQERLDDKSKHWKFDPRDLEVRKHWDDYMAAYEDAIRETDTSYAPWYVVPANRKWFRDLAVMQLLVDTLADMNPKFPSPTFDPATTVVT